MKEFHSGKFLLSFDGKLDLYVKRYIFVTVHSYLVPVTDFADASHSKSAKSAATTVSYGIFSSENACL